MNHRIAFFTVLAFFAGILAQEGMRPFPQADVEKKMDQHLLIRLSTDLDLDEKTLVSLTEILKTRRESMGKIRAEIEEKTKKLDEVLADSTASEKSLREITGKILELQSRMPQAEDVAAKNIEKLLSPRRFAQYILILRDFRRDMWKMFHGRGDREKRKFREGGE